MRELKFRVWDNFNKCYFKPVYEAYNGRLSYLDIGLSGHVVHWEMDENRKVDSSIIDDQNGRWIINQFTGLRDKNGVGIYESDIIKTPMGFIGKVVFINHSYTTKTDIYACTGWIFETAKGHREFLDKEILGGEIIGNLYENPELLLL